MYENKYALLPDGMDAVEVQRNLSELLSEAEADADRPVIEIVRALYELADRQWHTYTILPSEYKDSLEKWIREHWLPNSIEFIVDVGFIAGCIGLPGVLRLLEAERDNPRLPDDVRTEIRKIVDELMPTIRDPYSGIRK